MSSTPTPGSNRLEVVGLVESLTPFSVTGWAFNRFQPSSAVDLSLWVDGECLLWFRPQQLWPLLAKQLKWPESSLGPVRFQITLPACVGDGHEHLVEIRCLNSGKTLPVEGMSTVRWLDPNLSLTVLPRAWWPLATTTTSERAEPVVSLIVLNRNGKDVLSDLLDSWHNHNRSIPVEWIVIDHASTDSSLELLDSWRSRLDLQVIALDVNQSFSASSNLGASLARASLLLFLNNDLVWQHDALPVLIEALSDSSVGAVGMKLIKTMTGLKEKDTWQEVQHLGVRFVPHLDGYWPQETNPIHHSSQSLVGPQDVPCVTGAALLCRSGDFWAVGGFNEDYFYGFEDVDFCLNIKFKLGKRVVSRNDTWALHRHGHTRLTGRESSVTRQLAHNAIVLDRQWGLWLKHHWWTDLWSHSPRLGCDVPRIGIQVPDLPPPYGLADQLHPALTPLAQLAERIQHLWPNAKIQLVRETATGYWVKDLHVLVVSNPAMTSMQLQHFRSDLRLVAFIHDQFYDWRQSPMWWEWDVRLIASDDIWRQLSNGEKLVCQKAWAPHPVLGLAQSKPASELRWPVRAVIRWPDGPSQWNAKARRHAQSLTQEWASEGMCCRMQGPWPWAATQSKENTEPDTHPITGGHWVAEICIWIRPRKVHEANFTWPKLQPGFFNIIWWIEGFESEQTTHRADDLSLGEAFVWETDEKPDPITARQALEIEIGRPVFAP